MAGTAERVLALKLIGDVSDINKSMKQTQGVLKRTASAAKSWGKALTGALVLKGLDVLVGSLDDAIKGFKEGEQAARNVSRTWGKLGLDANELADTLSRLEAGALDLGFDDAEVTNAFNTFLTLTGDAAKSSRLVAQAMDLARARGIPFATAVKKVSTNLDETNQAFKRNKGAAQDWARHNPIAVTLGKINDAWSTFVGNLAAGNVTAALGGLQDIGKALDELIFGKLTFKNPVGEGGAQIPVQTGGLVAKFAEVGPKLIDAILGGLVELGGKLQTAWDEQIATVDWAKAIPDALSSFWRDTLQPFLTGLAEKGPVAAGAIFALAAGLTVIAAPLIAATLPIIALAVAVGLAAAAFVILMDKLPEIQKFFQDLLDTITGKQQPMREASQGLADAFSDPLVEAVNRVSIAAQNAKKDVATLTTVLGNLEAKLAHAKNMPPGILRSIFAGFALGQFAEGGIVTGPTVALIGERGPEAVIPLTGPNAGMGWTINVNVGVGDPVEIGRQVDRVLRAYRGRAGLAA